MATRIPILNPTRPGLPPGRELQRTLNMNHGPPHGQTPQGVQIDYTNHLGERAIHAIVPERIIWTKSPDHPEPQWFLLAISNETSNQRAYAMASIHAWDGPPPPGLAGQLAEPPLQLEKPSR